MSDSKRKTFTIDYLSDATGDKYTGAFTSKKLSILDQAKISRRKSELCGGMFCVRDDDGNPTGQGIDEWSEVQARMIAILEVALVQKPQWWDLDVLYDEELLGKVFEEVMLFENTFRRRAGTSNPSEVGDGSSQGDSQGTHTEANNISNAPQVVDEKVSASLDA